MRARGRFLKNVPSARRREKGGDLLVLLIAIFVFWRGTYKLFKYKPNIGLPVLAASVQTGNFKKHEKQISIFNDLVRGGPFFSS